MQMAKVIKLQDGNHLRGSNGATLCGIVETPIGFIDSELTCAKCANLALTAIELTTKVERREWRKL